MKQLDLFPGPNPLRVLVDVDGVLADTTSLFLDFVSMHYGLEYNREICESCWDPFVALGLPVSEAWEALRRYVREFQLVRKMSALPGAREFFSYAQTCYDVKVCTTPLSSEWLAQRAAWLEDFGVPLEQQIHTHDKSDLVSWCHYGAPGFDVLIDDKPENCEKFARVGRSFLLAAPYNEGAKLSPRMARGDYVACLAWLDSVARRPV